MTRFLASVRSVAEARAAVAAGADIIDAKDPARGALGALEPSDTRAIVEAVGGGVETSAVCGDLPVDPNVVAEAVRTIGGTGVDFVKLGLFPGAARPAVISALEPLARRFRLIGVFFADHGYDPDLLPALAAAGFEGAMIDTAGKDGCGLRDHLDGAALARFVSDARGLGLLAGLAGSLRLADVPALLPLAPDLLGFRGALSATGRAGALDPARLAAVRAAIPREAAQTTARVVHA